MTLLPLLRCAAILVFAAVFAAPLPAAEAPPKPLKVLIVGDSTVCNYPDEMNVGGWGQYLPDYFDEGVTFSNHALPGQSAATFSDKGLWKKAIGVKPDIVLIQFGTNDAGDAGYPPGQNHLTEYRTFLRRYIKSSRLSGAEPILVTPPCRRLFDPNGKISDAKLDDHADAMRQLAELDRVPLIDLNRSSRELLEKIGPDAAATLASARGDTTHFNKVGAKGIAALVMRELPAAAPRLREHLKAKEPAFR